MKICADGYMKVAVPKRVRTPGDYDSGFEPVPVKDAVAFLLSHTFPGHRRLCRVLTHRDCQMLRRALWADSVSERMTLVDRVWRSITEPVSGPAKGEPSLIQVVRWKDDWAYPLYLAGEATRVMPTGGVPVPELNGNGEAPGFRLE